MPRNNPLCRLIDQITSRWNTLPNSDHHTHRLPFRNGAFLFVQSHPRRSFHLASPRRTSLPPRHPFAGDTGLAKSRERHFLFHLRRGIVACGIINNRLRWFLRGLTREREGERIMFIPWARDYFSNERREKKNVADKNLWKITRWRDKFDRNYLRILRLCLIMFIHFTWYNLL